jgi:hypothetical protein
MSNVSLKRTTICAGSLVVVLVLLGVANGQMMMGSPAGVGGNPPVGPFVFDNGMAMVMTPAGGPIPIYIDPTAPHWVKRFQIPPTTAPIQPGTTFPIWEKILILPPPNTPGTPSVPKLPFTDWHERIRILTDPPTPPGFGWVAGGHLVVHNPADPGGTTLPPLVDVPGMVDPLDPLAIWFGPFPPLPIPPNGLPVWIHKQLTYTGTQPLPVGAPIIIEIWEHPTTPEPSSLILAGLSGLALIGLGRRRA